MDLLPERLHAFTGAISEQIAEVIDAGPQPREDFCVCTVVSVALLACLGLQDRHPDLAHDLLKDLRGVAGPAELAQLVEMFRTFLTAALDTEPELERPTDGPYWDRRN